MPPDAPQGKRRPKQQQRQQCLLFLGATAVFISYGLLVYLALYDILPGSQRRRHALQDAAARTAELQLGRRMALLQQPASVRDEKAERWTSFWRSEALAGLATLQALRDQLTWLKYQRLQKDVEPQHTAGLDLAVADTLQSLQQQTVLGAHATWLQEQVTSEVFVVLNALQHPRTALQPRKLLCVLDKGCGFGCQIHHAVHCLTHAVALNRTLILQVDPWRYSPGRSGQETWEQLMAPVSSCRVQHLQQGPTPAAQITDGQWHEQELEVFLDIIDSSQTSLDPPAMPPDVLQLVQLFSSRPEQWWIGVLSSYLLRPSPASIQLHTDMRRSQAWQSPIVGVHVRRTDKISAGEAKLHFVEEYMAHVERWCDWKLRPGWQAARPSNCSIYLATDEPGVLQEIRSSYPHIRVITNPVGLGTGTLEHRNSKDGAAGVYHDMLCVSATDFLVGTFSGQVSRLAYEVALVNRTLPGHEAEHVATDAALHYHSVDSIWYFGGMQHFEFCSKQDYTVGGTVKLKAGQHVSCDVIFPIQDGMVQCSIISAGGGTGEQVALPPGILGRCTHFLHNTYRPVLPAYMRHTAKPQPAVAA